MPHTTGHFFFYLLFFFLPPSEVVHRGLTEGLEFADVYLQPNEYII